MSGATRKDQIIDACVDLIGREGVAGVSHRKVADAAGVPLGSMTYYFDGITDLLHQAFSRFAERAGAPLQESLRHARGHAEALDAIADVIMASIYDAPDDLTLSLELYTIAARRPEFQDITDAWMRRSRVALEQHFPPLVARDIDAFIEGLTLHGALNPQRPTREQTLASLRRMTGEAQHA